jgi:hypothetical protein
VSAPTIEDHLRDAEIAAALLSRLHRAEAGAYSAEQDIDLGYEAKS